MNDSDPIFTRWTEVDALFQRVLEYPPHERRDYFRQVCGPDDDLYRLTGELLDSLESADEFLEDRTLIISSAAALEPDPDMESGDETGRQLGAYRLLRQLGRGGSGTVYLAERVDGEFERRVAIKLLRRGLDTADLLTRFRAERQILASLDHPNIARLLDGGATEDGRPYLVMELVRGIPITRYCARERLTIEARLQLFATVARAVGYAHRNLVVHRDLKPSNILVTDTGSVKLLDFGIAKLLDATSDPDLSPRTRTGVRLMTPEYASPEQLRGESVTTATDIYQLGGLLYEILTGRRPHGSDRRSRYDLERAAREDRPEAPSMTVSGPNRVDPEFADSCCTEPRRLRRRLRGDLDTIVLTALRKEPERRYQTVAGLVADLERHLEGRPITARADSWSYRIHKLIRRHPGRITAGLIATLALVGYLFTLVTHAERVEAERDRALLESAKVSQLSDFLQALFQVSEPDQTDGRSLTALDLLRQGEAYARRLDVRLGVKAEIFEVIGVLYTQIGEYERAEPLLREALALHRKRQLRAGNDRGNRSTLGLHQELAIALDRLGTLLSQLGNAEEEEDLPWEATEIAALTDGR